MDGFLLATPEYVLRASGGPAFTDPFRAVGQLRTGRVPYLVGALPFRPGNAAALSAPDNIDLSAAGQSGALAALPDVRVLQQIPEPAAHKARVAALVDRLHHSALAKVVAARAIDVVAAAPIDPELLLRHLLTRHPQACGYAVDLSDAGRAGEVLVGASPETLVQVRGQRVTLRPLAGSAPRSPDPRIDEQNAEKLLASIKNRAEHSYVIDWIRERLHEVCVELVIPAEPELTATPDVWHLASPIVGCLADPATTALDLALLLHPTPAVAGTPQADALALIAEAEGDRSFYGGAVGWCDSAGDGDWIVAIRCAELSADRRTARVRAGGGIVIGSDPQLELDETTAKFGTLLAPLGLRLDR